MSSSRVTLRQIAQQAGVHFTTVSLALRNHPSIPKKTRESLQALSRRMGYLPDPMLKALSNYRHQKRSENISPLLGYLTRWSTAQGWMEKFPHADFYRGALQRANALGFQLENIWLREPGITLPRREKILLSRNFSGLIVAPIPEGYGHLRLPWHHFSVVRIGTSVTRPALHTVTHDQFEAIRLAVRECWKRKYQRVGLALWRRNNERVQRHWSGGFLAEQEHWPKSRRLEPFLPEKWDENLFARWFKRTKPDVIITAESHARNSLSRLGIQSPESVGLLELDLHPDSHRISGIIQDHEGVGAAAVEKLHSMITHFERGVPQRTQTILMECAWNEGTTLRPRS